MDLAIRSQLLQNLLSTEAVQNLPRLAHTKHGWLERVNRPDDVAYISVTHGNYWEFESIAERAFAMGKRVILIKAGALRQ
ncbi:hypothetical protein ACVIHC_002176 [Bradyrhizobium diazoefficiens]